MKTTYLLMLYGYNYWANARILEASSRVKPNQYSANAGLSHRSLRGTLVHIIGTEWIWRMRCQEGISPPKMLSEKDLPTLERLREKWSGEEKLMRAYLAGLTDADLLRRVHYTTTIGVPFENTLWHILVHVVNHGTQFRSEAGVLLSEMGFSPGDMDMIAYVRAKDYC